MRTTRRAAALVGAVVFSVALVACNKKNNEGAVVDTTAAGTQTATVSVDTTPIKVSDIQVGKSVGSDQKISNSTTAFGARDTMYVSVITNGAAKDAKISTKWMFNGTKVVDSSTQTISPTGGTNATEFHITKKTAWPKGKYTVEVILNGMSAGTKDLEVK
ncbi:MAG: hypothetical protein DMD72_09315 [Gemmatimonadetes bacterium]|nr:MAG: hypothetical protein DMD72_09315 [Gemmatimonadota bacterium]